MKTMVPLRIAAIISNVFFIGYGLLAKALPTFFMYAVLLPINCSASIRSSNWSSKVKVASQGDLSMDWLKPFMTRRNYQEGRRAVPQGRRRRGDVLHGDRQIPGVRSSTSSCRPAA